MSQKDFNKHDYKPPRPAWVQMDGGQFLPVVFHYWGSYVFYEQLGTLNTTIAIVESLIDGTVQATEVTNLTFKEPHDDYIIKV